MDLSQSAPHTEHTQGQSGFKVDPQDSSIQYTDNQQCVKDIPGHGAYTPLTEGPTEKPSGLADTAKKGLNKCNEVEHGEGGSKSYLGFSKRELRVVLMMGLVEFCIQAFLSLLGPFYAVRAQSKGVSATEVGLIFGIVPLVALIVSPLFGTYIRHIGVKFLLVAGIMTVGCCSLLLGFVDWVEDRVAYVVLCLAVRGVEGVGTAAGHTAVYSLLTHTFPHRLATMSGYIEAMAAAGFIMGAPTGGALYQAGGFLLTFALTGAFLLLVGLVLWVATPSPRAAENAKHKSFWGLLLRPSVLLLLLNVVAGVATTGFFLSLTGEVISTQFLFSPTQVSLVYLCAVVSYVLGTLIWGALIKRWPEASPLIFSVGYIGTGITLMFWGPAPFMPLHSNIVLFFVCACLILLGLSAELIAYYILGTEAKEVEGASLDMSGWLGGVLNAAFSLGAFIGPMLTGYMYDTLGFPWTCTGVGGLLLVLAFAQLLNHVFSNNQLCSKRPEGEKVPFANLTEQDHALYTE